MNRVFQILQSDQKFPFQFHSNAKSSLGVFRSFAKRFPEVMCKHATYILYVSVAFGFQKVACAYWNGKVFVKLASNLKNKELVEEFLSNNKDFVL